MTLIIIISKVDFGGKSTIDKIFKEEDQDAAKEYYQKLKNLGDLAKADLDIYSAKFEVYSIEEPYTLAP